MYACMHVYAIKCNHLDPKKIVLYVLLTLFAPEHFFFLFERNLCWLQRENPCEKKRRRKMLLHGNLAVVYWLLNSQHGPVKQPQAASASLRTKTTAKLMSIIHVIRAGYTDWGRDTPQWEAWRSAGCRSQSRRPASAKWTRWRSRTHRRCRHLSGGHATIFTNPQHSLPQSTHAGIAMAACPKPKSVSGMKATKDWSPPTRQSWNKT